MLKDLLDIQIEYLWLPPSKYSVDALFKPSFHVCRQSKWLAANFPNKCKICTCLANLQQLATCILPKQSIAMAWVSLPLTVIPYTKLQRITPCTMYWL